MNEGCKGMSAGISFADDSLFFCKAHKEECHTILRILKEHEAVSGQLINLQKSSIQFGYKIEEFI